MLNENLFDEMLVDSAKKDLISHPDPRYIHSNINWDGTDCWIDGIHIRLADMDYWDDNDAENAINKFEELLAAYDKFNDKTK